MTISSNPFPVDPEPTRVGRGGWTSSKYINNPAVRLIGYVLSWFIFSTSFIILAYVIQLIAEGGGRCVAGNSPFVIRQYCPQFATDFLPWVIFTALIGIGIGLVFAYGIGIQLIVWAWPILMGSLALLFFSGPDLEGILLGLMFAVFAVVPLISEFRGSVQRVFVGSSSIAGRQFKEGANARKSFTQRIEPNLDGATPPRAGDWAISIIGFVVPALAGYVVATLWVLAVVG